MDSKCDGTVTLATGYVICSVDFKSGDPGIADIQLVPSGPWAFPGGRDSQSRTASTSGRSSVSGFAVGGPRARHVCGLWEPRAAPA